MILIYEIQNLAKRDNIEKKSTVKEKETSLIHAKEKYGQNSTNTDIQSQQDFMRKKLNFEMKYFAFQKQKKMIEICEDKNEKLEQIRNELRIREIKVKYNKI